MPELDPLGESNDENAPEESPPAEAVGDRSSQSEYEALKAQLEALKSAYESVTDQLSEQQLANEELQAKIAEIEKQIPSLSDGEDEEGQEGDGHKLQRRLGVKVPRRLTANFAVVGAFGSLAFKANDVVTDPDHIKLLKEHDAPMVRA